MYNIQGSRTITRRAKDGDDGSSGKGILEIQDFYGVSYSDSILPSSWVQSSIPAKAASQFLWNYEKITYSDGTFDVTQPRVIQGKDARSIDYIKNAFAYGASKATAPTGNWQWTIEALGVRPTGYFLWMRDDIFYTDGTSSATIPRLVIEGKDGIDGGNGLPGQIPIQKEWKQGDTHRFNDSIIDYIYVRGINKDQSYWYKRAAKGDVTAGAPPSGGATPSGYEKVTWLKDLAVNVLLAEEANLAGFIFKNGVLISLRGTVNGVAEDYSGQSNFVPNLILNGAEGDVKITGAINAKNGTIEKLTIASGGYIELPPTFASRKGRLDNNGLYLIYDGNNSQKIEWATGLGSYAGSIAPNSNGYLTISSTWGVSIQAQQINIGTEGFGETINIGGGLGTVDFGGGTLTNIREITNMGFTTLASLSTSIASNTDLTIQHDAPMTIITSIGTNSYVKAMYMNSSSLVRDGAVKWILNRVNSGFGIRDYGNIRIATAGGWIIPAHSLAVFVYSAGYWYKS